MDYQTKRCIANALWHESRGESAEGQRAVLDTIINRQLKSGKSACHEITRPAQFSWWVGIWKPYTPKMRELLERTRAHPTVLPSKSYQFFYSLTALDRPPYWAASMDCTPIGNHAFCKLKGTP